MLGFKLLSYPKTCAYLGDSVLEAVDVGEPAAVEAKEAIFKQLALAGKRLDLGLLRVEEVEEVPVDGLPCLLVTPPHHLGVQPGEL